ncbi:hypothetical protein MUA77_00485 [Mammaliicoccus sciuri]|uniref:hypothetical protein n=1 Tax=Mammaliicoccus sciuri TaxID=1296 RepID=UPI0021D05707|nr:hypothetical protein [Mammaliicoccus sciuri]UXU83951.1 hypothetical protein MUA77_00485 [Mammaliicoccus sciuri]UXU93798.1 hypothetical protein MUA42_00485 [Mammaliicoccus sciuri]UXV15747.1 hypothetical protein MUA89_00485 [Mammaliicoccus sciuri]UXV24009.1 hypothetical protein MUA49_00485 [Mammaliicoccus sciuri]UXV26790.1 hypothetical protein MUA96_00485 [Mammaliicoccus sciuri]
MKKLLGTFLGLVIILTACGKGDNLVNKNDGIYTYRLHVSSPQYVDPFYEYEGIVIFKDNKLKIYGTHNNSPDEIIASKKANKNDVFQQSNPIKFKTEGSSLITDEKGNETGDYSNTIFSEKNIKFIRDIKKDGDNFEGVYKLNDKDEGIKITFKPLKNKDKKVLYK